MAMITFKKGMLYLFFFFEQFRPKDCRCRGKYIYSSLLEWTGVTSKMWLKVKRVVAKVPHHKELMYALLSIVSCLWNAAGWRFWSSGLHCGLKSIYAFRFGFLFLFFFLVRKYVMIKWAGDRHISVFAPAARLQQSLPAGTWMALTVTRELTSSAQESCSVLLCLFK